MMKLVDINLTVSCIRNSAVKRLKFRKRLTGNADANRERNSSRNSG